MAEYRLNMNRQGGGVGNCYVHRKECNWYPQSNYLPLGWHSSCSSAVRKARFSAPKIKNMIFGCFYCSRPCNEREIRNKPGFR